MHYAHTPPPLIHEKLLSYYIFMKIQVLEIDSWKVFCHLKLQSIPL